MNVNIKIQWIVLEEKMNTKKEKRVRNIQEVTLRQSCVMRGARCTSNGCTTRSTNKPLLRRIIFTMSKFAITLRKIKPAGIIQISWLMLLYMTTPRVGFLNEALLMVSGYPWLERLRSHDHCTWSRLLCASVIALLRNTG